MPVIGVPAPLAVAVACTVGEGQTSAGRRPATGPPTGP